MKNLFEARIRTKIESRNDENILDILVNEFPQELQERLEKEIDGMDQQAASDYLIGKLIARRESLVEWSIDSLPQDIEVSHEVPLAVLGSLETLAKNEPESILGSGQNGRIYQSVRWKNTCYKVLFLERARRLQLSIVREAVTQHDCAELLKGSSGLAHIPEVIGFIEHPDVLAIRMEKVNGNSFLDIFEGKGELPANFDLDSFFEKLERTMLLLNAQGYFHRDLTNNSGNVMVDDKGEPWIIDFGSAIKGLSPDEDTNSYQITPGGARIIGNDISGLRGLKQKVAVYLRDREKENGKQQ